ncbi:MAG: sulfatase-like hydrolase/transferase [Candidatus Lernaella stagnicola]|nr:sulfatase-like hydrolase/transferase [Candidatus Lernaella stagnicola]
MLKARSTGHNVFRFGAWGVLGGVFVGLADTWLARESLVKVWSESDALNVVVTALTGAAMYSQVFAVALILAAVFFLFLSLWPRRKDDPATLDTLGLAVTMMAGGGLYAAIAVNAWALGIRSWQSVVGNAVLLAGALMLVLVLVRMLTPSLGPRLARRRILWAAGVVELVALATLVGLSLTHDPTFPDRPVATPDAPNIVLVTVDTLRADHLSCYGYDKIRTPNMDRLAADGIAFDRHIAATSWTLPSIASLHSGVYPDVHDQFLPTLRLDSGFATTAEVLRERGYLTAAYLTNAYLVRKFGFDQGFDAHAHAKNHRSDPVFAGFSLTRFLMPMLAVRHAAENVAGDAVDFLRRHRDRRLFLWIHYIDPHIPYGAWYINQTPAYATKHLPSGRAQVNNIDPFLERRKKPTADDLLNLNAAYDAEILYLDKQIGRLRDGLAELGLDRNTLFVFTADHGEEFYDHEYWFHGFTLYQETVRVPLLVAWPGRVTPGRRSDVACGTIDIAPTLASIAGAAPPLNFVGKDLRPWLFDEGPKADDPPVFSMLDKWGKTLRGVHTRRWDLILDMKNRGAELYDAAADPRQTNNLASEREDVVEYLQSMFETWSARTPALREKVRSGQDNRIELDRETLQYLRNLGYLS